VDDHDRLAAEFESHRAHLRAVAYRMLGSATEAEDAVQESWLRLSRTDAGDVRNLRGWLTTVVARVCLDLLRSRTSRREEPVDVHAGAVLDRADPAGDVDPEREALLADSVGLALLVVLDTLRPAERLAFVLHDMFGVPFDEIAPIVDRSPAAARQLASRARRRVRGARPEPDADLAQQREVVDAFVAASREGDFDALVAVLDPDVVLRSDGGGRVSAARRPVEGADRVARFLLGLPRLEPGASLGPIETPDGLGFLATLDGRPSAVFSLRVQDGRITDVYVMRNPDKLTQWGLTTPA
jgi:RNA polymerase sigma factor (sigma-70 family)